MNLNVIPTPTVDAPILDDVLMRKDLYALLGGLLLQPPSVGQLHELVGLTVRPGVSAGLDRCLQQMKCAARAGNATRVGREFADVFIGLGCGEVVPYASWYLGSRLMAEPLVNLRRDLAALNICLQKNIFEFEDHAAAMCATMAQLVTNPMVAADKQAYFFNSHLAPWMNRFFDDLQRAPSAEFYTTVGRVGDRFMRQEHQRLSPPASPKA